MPVFNKSGYKDDAVLLIASVGGNIGDIKKFLEDYPTSDKCKTAYIYIAEKYYQNNNDYDNAKVYYDKAFEKYGKTDEEINTSYSQFLITRVYEINKKDDATEEDWRMGLQYCNECIDFVKGSVNEASVYYYSSLLYLKLGDKDNANNSIDKAIEINPTKKFKEQKEIINK